MGKKFKFNKREHIGKKINEAADNIAAKEPAKLRNLRRFAEKYKLRKVLKLVPFRKTYSIEWSKSGLK